MTDRPPWEIDGLPCGLTGDHFSAAARVVIAGVSEGQVRPLLGANGWYFHLSGTDYQENVVRLDALARVPPLIVDGRGRSIHPAVFVPDPSQSETDRLPLGVCLRTGYVGSTYSEQGTALRPSVERGAVRGRFLATRAAVERDAEWWRVSVWLPTAEPDWQRR